MKYDLKYYATATAKYRQCLQSLSKKTVLIEFNWNNKKAYYSLAPLTQALHELNADLNVSLHEGKSKNLEILCNAWKAFLDLEKGVKSPASSALEAFILEAEKKAGKGKIKKALSPPEAVISACQHCFFVETSKGAWFLPFREKWFKERCKKGLRETAKRIIVDGFALKKRERFSIGFEIMPKKTERELPFEDYLDNFAIALAMAEEAKKRGASVSMGSSTNRKSKVEPMNRISELKSIISGCEHDKKVKEKVFQKYSILSSKIGAKEWENADAAFSIIGKGYSGKHIFGTTIGYPSPNRKTRWTNPSSMFLKPAWHPQTKTDKRMPKTRIGITETLPIENFVRTCNINYNEMRALTLAIKKQMSKSEKIIVQSKGFTNLEILLTKGKKRRKVTTSDADATKKLNREILKEEGLFSGMFANFPSGEAFCTPESIEGTAIGDVVINLDRSHVLNPKNPLVVEFKKGRWRLARAPPAIKKKMEKELSDAKKLIKEYEKNKSLPAPIIKQYKENLDRVGEFAINTNPKARLSNYLIENEKIAKMIHIALGSGFEPDRQTLYHWDFVINSPRQKLDIYGLDKKGKKHWIIRKGKFTV
ncbi:MAG: hypothetical protein QXK06_04880 [Candidatus Diapherotrites archaeon]